MKKLTCDKCDREFGSKEALNMHNKSKHTETHKESKFSNTQKKRIRNYTILFLIILIIGGFFYWRSIPPKNAPILEIGSSYNFGTVSQAKGSVSGTLTLSNNGNKDLIIKSMDTSCGCTTASIIYNEVEGPVFSMASHGTNPKDWRQIIPPGESAQLKIYYNPNVHKNMRGSVRRSVFLETNDPRNRNKEITTNVYQVD